MVDPTFVLAMMLKAQPAAPWRASYERTAVAIARASSARPLFAGADGAERTAALVVSVAWFESRFQPDAEGDRPCLERDARGECSRRGEPQSFCALQVGRSNLAWLGVTRERLLEDVDACVDVGLRMMHLSFRVCRAEPLEHRLAHYAAGGYRCPLSNEDASRKSGHRMAKAIWLFQNTPRS